MADDQIGMVRLAGRAWVATPAGFAWKTIVRADHLLIGDQALADAWRMHKSAIEQWKNKMRVARQSPFGELWDWFDEFAPRGGYRGRQLSVTAEFAMNIYKHFIVETRIRQIPAQRNSPRAGRSAGLGRLPLAKFDEQLLREARQQRLKAAAEFGKLMIVADNAATAKEWQDDGAAAGVVVATRYKPAKRKKPVLGRKAKKS